MAMKAKKIKEWLNTIDENAEVGIDDGCLCLCVVGEPTYLEIGGIEAYSAFALRAPEEGEE